MSLEKWGKISFDANDLWYLQTDDAFKVYRELAAPAPRETWERACRRNNKAECEEQWCVVVRVIRNGLGTPIFWLGYYATHDDVCWKLFNCSSVENHIKTDSFVYFFNGSTDQFQDFIDEIKEFIGDKL